MAKVEKRMADEHTRVQRGWGHEVWIENLPDYCGKVLFLKGGKRCSLHFHMKKKETMFLQSGDVAIKFVDPDTGKSYIVNLSPGQSVLIEPGQVHQIIANEDSALFEFSTEHFEEDSYRVQKGD